MGTTLDRRDEKKNSEYNSHRKISQDRSLSVDVTFTQRLDSGPQTVQLFNKHLLYKTTVDILNNGISYQADLPNKNILFLFLPSLLHIVLPVVTHFDRTKVIQEGFLGLTIMGK